MDLAPQDAQERELPVEHAADKRWPAGASELARLIREFDWSTHQLGPIDTWPQSLKTTVDLMLLSTVPLVLLWGEEGIMLYNDAYSVFAGGRHPELLGSKVLEGWHEVADFNRHVMDVGLAGGTLTFRDHVLVLYRQGLAEDVWLDLFYSPVLNEAGHPAGVLAVVVEITRRVVNQRRLNALRAIAAKTAGSKSVEAAAVLSCAACAEHPQDVPVSLIYLLEPDQKVARLIASAGAEAGTPEAPRHLEWGDSAPAGRTWHWENVLSQRSANFHVSAFQGDDASEALTDHWAVLPLGDNKQEQFTGFVVVRSNPKVVFDDEYRSFFELVATGISQSIIQAQGYEQEARRAAALAELDRAKTAFFSNVSHEFRTPLTLMLGPTEDILAKPDINISAEVRDSLKVVHRSGLRLQRLVNTLLDFSRIEAGRVQASYQATDLAAFTTDLASSFRSATDRAGLTLTVDCPSLPEPVYVDREMWEKVVLNLVSNAFKFTLEGSITVRLRPTDGQAELAVADTGTGIPAAELPHLFERFHRVEGAHGRTHEGTGIGLALVQELVKLHGGTVQVESEVGKGTTFKVSLPFGTEHLPAERIQRRQHKTSTAVSAEAFVEEALRWLPEELGPHASAGLPAAGYAVEEHSSTDSAGRILLADDNADMREYVRRLLSVQYTVEAVTNGKQALERALAAPPDLVLSDVMMPELDGFALVEALRSDSRTKTVPIILLSARAEEEALSTGMGAGADDYLVKPFSARELVSRVGAHLRLGRARKEAEQAVRDSEARFRAYVTASSDVVYCMSADWSEMQSLQGRGFLADTGEPSRDWFTQYIYPDDQEQVLTAIRQAIEKKSLFELEHRVIRVDRTVGWAFSRAVPLFDAQGNIKEWFGAAREITERKQAEEALQRFNEELQMVNRELEEFAYVASHDLQEPLRMVNIYSQLLMKHFSTGAPEAEEYAQFIRKGVSRMERLLNDLLTYSRSIQREEQPIGTADLGEALREALSVLQSRIAESQAVIHFGELPEVRGETQQVAHVFQNLISNALKYRKAGQIPTIDIAAERADGQWVISIRDNGIGFEQQYAEKIFGLFKRLHKDEYPGTGLGLAICQRTVERYGGRMWAEGKSGAGATFFFALPVAESV